MIIAQQLYEGIKLPKVGSVGLITYMRTDSTRISEDAKVSVLEYINENFGETFWVKPLKAKVKMPKKPMKPLEPQMLIIRLKP